MTYNILCGGLPVAGRSDRREAVENVIRAAAPDVLALQECVGFEVPGAMDAWAARLGLPHYAIARTTPYTDGLSYNVTVFSRFFMRKRAEFVQKPFQTGALLVHIDTPDGVLSLCNVHLHAFNESARLVEIEALLTAFGDAKPDIILGDLNAISRGDGYAPNDEFESRYDVSDRLAQGYSDLGAPAGMTHPSRLPADHSRQIARRIDYVWGREIAGAAVRVVRDEQAHLASDHFAVVVDFA